MTGIGAILTFLKTETILLIPFHKFGVVFLNLNKLSVTFGDSGILHRLARNSQKICRRINLFVLRF